MSDKVGIRPDEVARAITALTQIKEEMDANIFSASPGIPFPHSRGPCAVAMRGFDTAFLNEAATTIYMIVQASIAFLENAEENLSPM